MTMTGYLRFILILGLSLAWLAGAGACARPRKDIGKIHKGKGLIIEVAKDKKSVVIHHETIENFMDAMTMTFQVKDPKLLDGITRHDTVNFELTVTNEEEWISRLEKTGHDAEADARPQSSSNNALPVLPGQTVPDFTLTDQDNRTVKLSDFRGKAVALTFIYTRCPMPDMCPRLNRHFAAVNQQLAKRPGSSFQLLSVTIDPAYDTPAVLKTFAENEKADLRHWRFLTGPEETIRRVAKGLGLGWQEDGGLVTHNMVSAVIGPDGTLAKLYPRNDWKPEEIVADIQRLVPAG